MSNAKLSDAQQKALLKIEQRPGYSAKGLGIRPATVWALERKGLVCVKVTNHSESVMCRGAYGRWIGGTRTESRVVLELWPAGHAEAPKA